MNSFALFIMDPKNWLIVAFIAPLAWAICNSIDKIIIEKYFKEGGIGGLLIFSALSSIVATPIFYFIDPSVLDVDINNLLVLVITALLDIALLWSYLKAMQRESASNVVLFYQLVPIFGIVSGYLFLKELVTHNQLIAMMIVLIGTSIVSFEAVDNKLKFKKETVKYMFIACFCWATELAIFKEVAIAENVWRSLFWKHIILVLLGIGMYFFIKSSRESFLKTLRMNSVPVFSALFAVEVLYMLGTAAYGVAIMNAPVSFVLLTVTFQSIFIFMIGIFIAKFIPKLATEVISKRHVLITSTAILITGLGTYMLLVV